MTRAMRVFACAQFNQMAKGNSIAKFAFPHEVLPVFDFLNDFPSEFL
jgi:hypothetical protein